MCMISTEDLHAGNLGPKEERTKELFEAHFSSLRAPGSDVQTLMTQTGVRDECPLNVSKYFHIARNKIFDPMHNIFAGVGPLTLKLVINRLVFLREFVYCRVLKLTNSIF